MENIFKKEFWESKTGKDLKIPFFIGLFAELLFWSFYLQLFIF